MVLRGYLHTAGHQVLDRMISTVVAEFQLIGAASHRQSENLVAKADAENRLLADQLFHRPNAIGDGLRITGAIAQEDAVRIQLKHLFGRGLRRATVT